jgi:hypothetical protein
MQFLCLVGRFLKIFFSDTALPNEPKFGGKHLFRNRPIRNKNCLWRPYFSMDREEIRSLYREPAIDATYYVSVHLAKRFQRTRILKISQSETRIACGDHVC